MRCDITEAFINYTCPVYVIWGFTETNSRSLLNLMRGATFPFLINTFGLNRRKESAVNMYLAISLAIFPGSVGEKNERMVFGYFPIYRTSCSQLGIFRRVGEMMDQSVWFSAIVAFSMRCPTSLRTVEISTRPWLTRKDNKSFPDVQGHTRCERLLSKFRSNWINQLQLSNLIQLLVGTGLLPCLSLFSWNKHLISTVL